MAKKQKKINLSKNNHEQRQDETYFSFLWLYLSLFFSPRVKKNSNGHSKNKNRPSKSIFFTFLKGIFWIQVANRFVVGVSAEKNHLHEGQNVLSIPDQVIEVNTPYVYGFNETNVGSGHWALGFTNKGDLLPSWLNFYPKSSVINEFYQCFRVTILDDIAYSGCDISDPNSFGNSIKIYDVSDAENIHFFGKYPIVGTFIKAAQINQVAYFLFCNTSGVTLDVVDVADYKNPEKIDSFKISNRDCSGSVFFGTSIFYKNQILMIAGDDAGLLLFDIKNKKNPLLLTTIRPSFFNASLVNDVVISGDSAYFIVDNRFLKIFNITTNNQLFYLSTYDTNMRDIYTVAVLNNMLFVSSGGLLDGLLLLDASDIFNPILLSAYNLQQHTYSVAANKKNDIFVFSGAVNLLSLAYGLLQGVPFSNVVGQPFCLEVKKVDDLGQHFSVTLEQRFSITPDFFPKKITNVLQDKSVFTDSNFDYFFNIKPLFLNQMNSFLKPSFFTIENSMLNWLAINIVPVPQDQYYQYVVGQDVVVLENIVFALSRGGPLFTFEINNLKTPLQVIMSSSCPWGEDLLIHDNIAYVACGSDPGLSKNTGINIFNVSNPRSMFYLDTIETEGFVSALDVTSNRLYASENKWFYGIEIFNLNTSPPILVNKLSTQKPINNIAVDQGLSYVVTNSSFDIYNITDYGFALIGNISTNGYPMSLSISNNKAYVGGYKITSSSGSYSTFEIFNITDPENIIRLGSSEFSCVNQGTIGITKIVLKSSVAFLTSKTGLLYIVDILNPYNPKIIGNYSTSGLLWGIDIVETSAFLIKDGTPGLLRLDLNYWQLQGTPSEKDVGNFELTIRAEDELGGTGQSSFKLRVEGPPKVDSTVPFDTTIRGKTEQTLFMFIPQGYIVDPNNDYISYSAAGLPPLCSFNSAAAFLSWRPRMDQYGNYSIDIVATDNIAGDVKVSVNLIVTRPPQVNRQVLPPSLQEGRWFEYPIPNDTMISLDGLPLVYTASLLGDPGLPPWMQFSSNLTFYGIPNTTGSYSIKLTATDPDQAYADTLINFQVNIPIQPHLTRQIGTQTAIFDQPFLFEIPSDTFTSAYGNVIHTLVEKLPVGLFYNDSSRMLFGVFKQEHEGCSLNDQTFSIPVIAQDGALNTTTSFDIQVLGLRILNPISDQIASVGRAFRLNFGESVFTNPNRIEPLIYNIEVSGHAPWLKIDNNNRTLLGEPSRQDTNFFKDRVISIDLIAYYKNLNCSTQFKINVGGQSNGEYIFKIAAGLFSARIILPLTFKLVRMLFNFMRDRANKKSQTNTRTSRRLNLSEDAGINSIKLLSRDIEKFESYEKINKPVYCSFFKSYYKSLPTNLPYGVSYRDGNNSLFFDRFLDKNRLILINGLDGWGFIKEQIFLNFGSEKLIQLEEVNSKKTPLLSSKA